MSNSNPSLTSQPLSLLPLLASTLSLLLLKPLFHHSFSHHSTISPPIYLILHHLFLYFPQFLSFQSLSIDPTSSSPFFTASASRPFLLILIIHFQLFPSPNAAKFPLLPTPQFLPTLLLNPLPSPSSSPSSPHLTILWAMTHIAPTMPPF